MHSSETNFAAALLLAIEICEWHSDWLGVERPASAAIEYDDKLAEARVHRALARRVLNVLQGPEGAIADYDRCIDIDPQNARAWEFRGACYFTLAGGLAPDYRIEMQAKAEQDYHAGAPGHTCRAHLVRGGDRCHVRTTAKRRHMSAGNSHRTSRRA